MDNATTTNMDCTHEETTAGPDRCYSGGARDERAAGGVEWTEMCSCCGAERVVRSNCGFVDHGEWWIV